MDVVIAGLSSIGRNLGERLSHEGNEVLVIDLNAAKCTEMAESSNVMAITGNATQRSTLEDARVKNADIFVAVTNDDSDNLMISLLAKEMGAKKVISLVNDAFHVETFKQAGINFQVRLDAVVAKHVHRMISQPYVKDFLSFEMAEIFEVEIEEGMRCVGKKVPEIGAPDGIRILVVER